ncbi:uncharacterized protein LOC111647012 [Seriola lalandi dorsalis]|uniref:uncharacterized protein LOC111647012 n=1 Tax=Seriola lalandi dorsalis TaxID=1841481 RepID=UPI000C6F916C|nr:uncharacterized protein LOC111647012 [Seriola lalandi dorsalis]
MKDLCPRISKYVPASTALKQQKLFDSVSVSEFHTVEVQSGEEVTLMCTNFTSSISHILWFRLDNRPNATCICSMFSSDGNATFCDGFQNGKFNMTSNINTLFLQIKQVDSSDSGLYFCGSYWNNWSTIVSATYLKVQGTSDFVENMNLMMTLTGSLKVKFTSSHASKGKIEACYITFLFPEAEGVTKLMNVILGVLTGFLVIIIGLVLKFTKPWAAAIEEPQRCKSLDSKVNDAALSVYSGTMRNGRPASEREVETRVFYCASR